MKSSAAKSIFKRILMLTFLFLVTFVIVLFVLNSRTPKYQTNARVLIEDKIQNIASIDQGSLVLSGVVLRNQLELLKSRTLFQTALNRLGMDSNPDSAVFNSYYSHFSVRQLPYSTMLELQLTGGSPETITDLTNVLVECLIEENNRQRSEEVTANKEYLTKKIEEIQLQKIEIQNSINKLPDSKIKQQSIPKVRNNLNNQALKYEKELKDIRYKITVNDWREADFIFSEKSPVIKDYKTIIRSYIVSLVNLLLQPIPDSKKIDELQAKIWREKVKAAGYMKKQLDALELPLNDNWQKVTFAYLRVVDFKMRQDIMGNYIIATSTNFSNEENKTQLVNELNSLTSSETDLIQKLTDLQVNAGLTDIEIRVVDKAIVPRTPYFPTFMQSLIMGFLAGLGVSMMAAYLLIIFGKEEADNQKPININ